MGKLTRAFEKKFKDVEDTNTTISNFPSGNRWDQRLRLSTNLRSPFLEKFRTLLAPIIYESPDKQPKKIMVTSVLPGEGKGFICANLGLGISQTIEYHALLVDCDLRRPTLAQLFGLTNETGLVDYLQDNVDLSLLIRKTEQPKLSILPSGKPPQNPSELLSSSRMATLIDELAERYPDRVILFDTPPAMVAAETNVLAKHLDGVILVVRHGTAPKKDVKKLVDTLGPENILGLVYNAYPENIIETFLNKRMKHGYDYNTYY